jgi:hypothetical protein
MANYLVVAVRKPLKSSDLQQISHIAYEESFFNPRVVISVEEVIKRISNNKLAFYVRGSRGTCYVTVEHAVDGKPYLKTSGNRVQADLLLNLRTC